MSDFCTRSDGLAGRRGAVRRHVELLGSIATIHGSSSVIIADLCPNGAKLIGRRLPAPGEEILLRTDDTVVLGRIAWANDDFRGVVFEEGEIHGPTECSREEIRCVA